MRVRFFIFLVLFAFAFASSSLFAQNTQNTQNTCKPPCPNPCTPPCPSPSTGGGGPQFEISPYAGYIWNANNNGVGSFFNTNIWGVRGGVYAIGGFEIGGNWSWNPRFQPKPENTTAAFAGDLGFSQAQVRSNLWELEFTYNFGSRGLFGHAVKPYLVAGAGGITTNLNNGNAFVLNNRFIEVPGVSTDVLQAAQANGTLQSFVPGANLTNGAVIVANPTATGTTTVSTPTGTIVSTSTATGTIASTPAGTIVSTGAPGSTVVVANDVFRDHANYFTFSYGGGIKLQRLWGPLGFFGDVRGRTIPNLFNGHQTNLLELSAGLNFAFGER